MELRSGETKENMTSLELPEGRVDIFYGSHRSEQNFPGGIEEALKDTDMLFLESIMHYTDIKPEDAYKGLNDTQYGEIEKYSRIHSLPIYLADSYIQENSDSQLLPIFMVAVEGLLGIKLAFSAFKNRPEESNQNNTVGQTRRQFLNKCRGLLAAYMVSPVAGAITNQVTETIDIGHETAADFQKINSYIHPELYKSFIVNIRNLLIAYKMIHEMKEQRQMTGENQNSGLVIGAAHVGIEDIFQKYIDDPTYFEKMKTELTKIVAEASKEDLCPTAKYLGKLQGFPDKEPALTIKQVL